MKLPLSRSQTRSGFSLIEFAISMAVLLPVVFGVIDINNTLRAYNALEKGSEVALRCVYPTDGACMEAANRAPQRLFNWFQSTRSDKFYVNDMQYRGQGEWLTQPTYTYDTYRASVLGAVSFQIPRYTYTERTPTYSVLHPVSVWVRRSGLPWIYPNDIVNPLGRDVKLTYDSGGTRPFPAITYALTGSNRTISTNQTDITLQFSLQNPLAGGGTPADQARAIFKANPTYFDDLTRPLPNNSGTALASPGAPLDNPYSSSAAGVRAIVYVKGQASNVNTTSKLLISINGEALGGRVLASAHQPNFYPRGAGLSNLDGGPRRVWSGNAAFAALGEWEHGVRLKPGQNEITIKRVSSDRGVNYGWNAGQTWTATSIEVYVPQYQFANFPVTCQQTGCTVSNCGTFNQIAVIAPSAAAAQYPKAVVNGPITQSEVSASYRDIGTYYSLPQALPASTCGLAPLIASSLAPSQEVTNQPCPANLGATSDPQRMALCPPVDPALTHLAGVSATAVTWSEAAITVPQSAAERAQGGWDFAFNKRDCSTPFSFSAPPSLARYAKYTVPSENDYNSSRTTRQSITGVTGRPSEIKSSTPAYACGAIELQTATFDGHTAPRIPATLPASSMFAGLYPQRAAGSACNVGLRQDAIQNGLPNEAWFDWTAAAVREVQLAAPPSDACLVFRQETVESNAAQPIAYNLPEGSSPAACANSTCRKTFAGLDTGGGGSQPLGAPDLSMAQTLAYEAIAASYPRARSGCADTSLECVKTTVEMDNAAAPKSASVRNTMRVPLNLLGGAAITLSNRQERELESSFVR